MNNKKLHKINQYIRIKILTRIDRKVLVYLVFVGISTVFWFLNKLDNEYNSTIEYPVRYSQLPKNKILVNELPKNLKLSVSAYGYDLLIYKISPAPFPIVLNLEDFGLKNASDNLKNFKLITRYARDEISNQLPNEINVLDILPDTITFQFANVIDKKVPVHENLHLTYAPQCLQNGPITFTPDSVIVSGPNTLIDTLQAFYTKFQSFDNLDKSLQRNIALREIPNLNTNKKRVVVNIPIAKFTEASFDVPVIPVNVPDSLELITFPGSIKVSGLISLSEFDKVKSSDFRVEADYLNIDNLIGVKVPLNLILAPSNMRDVDYYPSSVEFILEKKP